MYGEMMQYYDLVKDFDKADYFETEAFKSVLNSLEAEIRRTHRTEAHIFSNNVI